MPRYNEPISFLTKLGRGRREKPKFGTVKGTEKYLCRIFDAKYRSLHTCVCLEMLTRTVKSTERITSRCPSAVR